MKNIIAILITFVCINSNSFANSETEEFTSKVKINTSYDAILWIGQNMPETFDPKLLSKQDCEKSLEKGIEICEQKAPEGTLIFQYLLAEYYFTSVKNPNLRKALYWANEAAEQGCPDSMLILHDAYISGRGVVMDIEEGLKWCYLSAALGNKAMLKKTDTLFKHHEEKPVIEAKRRARLWMEEHRDLFFNAN